MSALEFVKGAAKIAEGKKANRVVLQDLRGQSDICEYQLICSGSNAQQTKAICQGIEAFGKNNFGLKPIAVEGRQSGNWILLDFGNSIIHIFEESIRDYYAVDRLWPKAKSVT